MSSPLDYIIVGQGLVGTWMSYYAQKAEKSFIVVNDPTIPSSTAVASGVINPVTGRRIVQTWMIDTLLPNAVNAYKELGKDLNKTLIKASPVVLLHPSLQMKESFEYRLTHENVYLSTNNSSDFETFFKIPFGTGQIDSSYWIDLNTMLAAWKKQLQQANSFIEERFELTDLVIEKEQVQWKNYTAKHIIFCDGNNSMENAYFKSLPFAPNKGEALIVQIKGLSNQFIYKNSVSIVPWKDDLFWVGSNYEWNFGPDASVNNVSSINVNGVSFNTTGPVNVTLTGSHLSCSEEVTHTIYLYSEPTINFSLADGLQCVPFNAQFTDLSTAETGILYQWDFGDGNTSNLQNPSHVYTQVGSYPVTLNIATVSGCVANLSLLQPDIVDVHPNPTSDFTLSKYSTDICDSEIEFFDKSIGGYSYLYLLDDSTFISKEQNPIHLYYSDGTKYPMQIVTNEWGCKDSSFQKLYIEPFTIFAPNTFTPDGNEFNNTFNPKLYLDVYQWELTIYNRWGELLFTSNDVNNGWDGVISNGLLAPSGTYIYKIKYVSCEPINPAKEITGHINLLR